MSGWPPFELPLWRSCAYCQGAECPIGEASAGLVNVFAESIEVHWHMDDAASETPFSIGDLQVNAVYRGASAARRGTSAEAAPRLRATGGDRGAESEDCGAEEPLLSPGGGDTPKGPSHRGGASPRRRPPPTPQGRRLQLPQAALAPFGESFSLGTVPMPDAAWRSCGMLTEVARDEITVDPRAVIFPDAGVCCGRQQSRALIAGSAWKETEQRARSEIAKSAWSQLGVVSGM